MAEAIGRSLGARRPVYAAVAAWAIAFVVLMAVIVGLGLLLTHVLLPAGLGRMDASWSRWFVPERTQTLNMVTRIGSDLGSTGVILGIAAVAIVVLAIGKHWRQIGFLVCAMTLEFGVFLVTTIIVGRQRPMVLHLDVSPPSSSFPSGHTATSLTLYVGLAIVLGSLIRGALVRRLAWVLAILLPIFVGISRLYRGMHFPTDVAASVLLGCGALLFALLAVRSMAAAAAGRDRRVASPPPADSPPEVTS
ncbi:MAG: phosphatase PAP2 family protein [Actinobacteria bacterium]|nr:phosphatase PAP2 family protein [Actinomycetota bacterium]